MTYIIDPMWFYWLNVVDSAKTIVYVVFVVSIIAVIVGTVVVLSNREYGADDEEYIVGKKILKISIPLVVVFALAVVFIPSKKTMIEIQVAKYATYENAEWTVEAIKSAVDYIVEAIKQLK